MALRHLFHSFCVLGCLITTATPSAAQPASRAQPTVTVADEMSLQVGAWVETVLPWVVETSGLSFRAQNLPKGLSCDAATGAISGYPQARGTHKVRLTASSGRLVTAVTEVQMQVTEFPTALQDEFQGLVPLDSPGAALGGLLAFKVTPGGAWSGKLKLNDRVLPVKGILRSEDGQQFESVAVVASGLTLKLQASAAGRVTARLEMTPQSGEAPETVDLAVEPRSWNARNPAIWPRGAYTVRLAVQGESLDVQLPAGFGHLSARVNPDGSVLMTGRLADGSAVIASGLLLAKTAGRNHVLLQVPLYPQTVNRVKASTGVLIGQLDLLVPEDEQVHLAAASALFLESATVPLIWMKQDQGPDGRGLFPRGFSLRLNVEGYHYVRPGRGQLLLGAQAGSQNALITFYKLGQTEGTPLFEHAVTLTAAHGVRVRADAASGVRNMRLTFNVATGQFSGSFTLANASQGKASFSGTLLTLPGGDSMGFGYVLMPEMSGVAGAAAGPKHSLACAIFSMVPENSAPWTGSGAPSGSGGQFGSYYFDTTPKDPTPKPGGETGWNWLDWSVGAYWTGSSVTISHGGVQQPGSLINLGTPNP